MRFDARSSPGREISERDHAVARFVNLEKDTLRASRDRASVSTHGQRMHPPSRFPKGTPSLEQTHSREARPSPPRAPACISRRLNRTA
eukprot:5600684-Pleurochrysis_carterae.AAC.1